MHKWRPLGIILLPDTAQEGMPSQDLRIVPVQTTSRGHDTLQLTRAQEKTDSLQASLRILRKKLEELVCIFLEYMEDGFSLRLTGSNTLYVATTQKKTERQQLLQRLYEEKRNERIRKNMASNLYVNSIDDGVDDNSLLEYFAQCGNITSAKIMRDGKGVSRGFGFVCYSSPEEAANAVNSLQGITGSPAVVMLVAYPPLYYTYPGVVLQMPPRRAYLSTICAGARYMPNGRHHEMSNGLMIPCVASESQMLSSKLSAASPAQQKKYAMRAYWIDDSLCRFRVPDAQQQAFSCFPSSKEKYA